MCFFLRSQKRMNTAEDIRCAAEDKCVHTTKKSSKGDLSNVKEIFQRSFHSFLFWYSSFRLDFTQPQ